MQACESSTIFNWKQVKNRIAIARVEANIFNENKIEINIYE